MSKETSYVNLIRKAVGTKGRKDQVTLENSAMDELSEKLYFNGYAIAIGGLLLTLGGKAIDVFCKTRIPSDRFERLYQEEYEKRRRKDDETPVGNESVE